MCPQYGLNQLLLNPFHFINCQVHLGANTCSFYTAMENNQKCHQQYAKHWLIITPIWYKQDTYYLQILSITRFMTIIILPQKCYVYENIHVSSLHYHIITPSSKKVLTLLCHPSTFNLSISSNLTFDEWKNQNVTANFEA